MIGYLSVKKIDGKHIGGILVVDKRGIPVEFKYTDPVVPTELQKILYGSSLETYLHADIIATSLLGKLENNPIVILTDHPDLVEVDKRVLLVSESTERVENTKEIGEGEYLIPFQGRAIRIVSKEKPSQEVLEKIKEISEELDIMEPFERLDRALRYVCSST